MILSLALLAVGLVAGPRVPARPQVVRVLDGFVVGVAIPGLVLSALPDVGLGGELARPVLVAWGGLALAAGLVLLLARRHGWPPATVGALLLVTPLGNTAFLGLPVVDAVLDEAAVGTAVAHDQLGTFLGLATYGSLVAARWGTAGTGSVARRLLTFPPFVALVLSFPVRAVDLPGPVSDGLELLGDLVGPVALLTLGLRFRWTRPPARGPALVWCLTTKMVVVPAAALAVCLALGVADDPTGQAVVLQSAMPPMVTAGVVAARVGLDEELASAVVSRGLALALVTLPAWRLALWAMA